MRLAIALLVLCITAAMAGEPAKALVDPMDTGAAFRNAFGTPPTTARPSGTGTVLLTRVAVGKDAGIDWCPGGKNIPVACPVLTLTFAKQPASGPLAASVLFFDKAGTFIDGSEAAILSGAATDTTIDVTSLGAYGRLSETATHYRLRLRPLQTTSPVVLDAICAGPAK